MKWTTRRIYVHTRSKEEERVFLELLDRYSHLPILHIQSKLGKITITMSGTKEQEITMSRQIKELMRGVRSALYADRKGRYFFETQFLLNFTNGSVNIKQLSEVINQLGYESEKTKYGILTTMPYDKVLDSIDRLQGINALMPQNLTQPMRSILAAAALKTGWRPLSLLDVGYVIGVFRDNAQGNAEFTMGPDLIMKKLIDYAETHEEFPEETELFSNPLDFIGESEGFQSSSQIVFKKPRKNNK